MKKGHHQGHFLIDRPAVTLGGDTPDKNVRRHAKLPP